MAALAFHGKLQEGERLLEFVQCESADVRRVAWEAVSMLKVGGAIRLKNESCSSG